MLALEAILNIFSAAHCLFLFCTLKKEQMCVSVPTRACIFKSTLHTSPCDRINYKIKVIHAKYHYINTEKWTNRGKTRCALKEMTALGSWQKAALVCHKTWLPQRQTFPSHRLHSTYFRFNLSHSGWNIWSLGNNVGNNIWIYTIRCKTEIFMNHLCACDEKFSPSA